MGQNHEAMRKNPPMGAGLDGDGQSLERRISQFIYRENRLLDEQRYREWLDLFADEGVYWVPTQKNQTDRRLQASIALEDKMLLKLRIDRMEHAQAHSLLPEVSGVRVIQQPCVPAADTPHESFLHARCNVVYFEHQGDKAATVAGIVNYTLRAHNDSFHIIEKRVDLLGADGIIPTLQLFV